MASRSLGDLHPKVQEMAFAWLRECRNAGIDVLVTCTLRSFDDQEKLYAQGRTMPGKKVTNAKPGESFHNYGLAIDFVPIVNGKPAWNDTELITQIGELAEDIGFEWAGRWTRFKELVHVQWSNGLTIKDLQSGRRP